MKLLSFCLALSVLSGFVPTPSRAAGTAPDEFDRLRERCVTIYTGGAGYRADDPVLGPRLRELVRRVASAGDRRQPGGKGYWDTLEVKGQRTNRLWRDIGRPAAGFTQANATLARLHEMARVYAMPASPLYRNAELARDIIEGIDFCFEQKYNESIEHKGYQDWFLLELGIPLRLLPTLMMLHDAVPPDRLKYYLSVVDRFTPRPDTLGGQHVPATGANLAWKCRVVAMAAILEKDGQRLAQVAPALAPLWETVTSGDGFYADGSFVQHRYYAYNGGYGLAATSEPLLVMQMLGGTPWSVDASRVQGALERAEKAYAPLMAGGEMMDMVRGREISRETSTSLDAGVGVARIYARLLPLVSGADRQRVAGRIKYFTANGHFFGAVPQKVNTLAEEVTVRALQLDDTVTPLAPEPGNRVFAAMDRVVHRTPQWTAGLSLYSDRIASFEGINGENRRGWYTGTGFLALYTGDGAQFGDNFWPTVDAMRLPGTTVLAGREAPGEKSRASFVGGATAPNGEYGVAAFQLQPTYDTALTGRKSWFFLRDAIVCLGAGLSGSPGTMLETIIENRKLDSATTFTWHSSTGAAGPALQPAPAQPMDLGQASWVHARTRDGEAGTGYYFPVAADLKCLREERTGSWSLVSNSSLEPASKEPIKRSYFTLWQQHTATGGSYNYVLLPGFSAAATEAYSRRPGARVLLNTAAVQAVGVAGAGYTGIVFWEAGSSPTTVAAVSVRASGPCLLNLQQQNGQLELSVADPAQKLTAPLLLDLTCSAVASEALAPEFKVVQSSPGLRLQCDLSAARGRTVRARFRLP